MNPQIRELIEKATTVRYSGLGEVEEFDREKFANLLIKKAASVMVYEDDYYGGWMGGLIKKHFGVTDEN